MMSGVASRCQVRYHQLMKHANLLQYVAALAVFGGIVTWVAMWQWTKGFGDILRRQSWPILWIVGKILGMGALITRPMVWMVHAMVDLWGPSAMTRKLDQGRRFLKLYAVRQFHH